MPSTDHVALRQLAVANALLSKKAKVEARREHLLATMNRMVTDRRALDVKIVHIDELLRARGHQVPTASPASTGVPAATAPTVPSPAAVNRTVTPYSPPPPQAPPIPLAPRPPAPENLIRERLVATLKERFVETDFSVNELLEIMSALAPEAGFRFETAWRLCNDLTARKVLKVTSQKMGEKGLVRRFKPV